MTRHLTKTIRSAVLAGVLVLTVAGGTAPTPASAHSYGHTCSPRIASSGFSCRTVRPTADIRGFDLYYNGSLRGSSRIWFAPGSSRATRLYVCDYNKRDTIRPTLRIQAITGAIYEASPNSNPDTPACRSGEFTESVRRYRALYRAPNHTVSHGTIWYTRTTG